MTTNTVPPSVSEFWNAFLSDAGETAASRFYEAFHFSDNEQSADELPELVLAGTKRATASLVWSYEAKNKPMPKAGDLSIVTTWAGEPLCVIETTGVDIVPFDQVTAEFASTEGEGDGSLAWWRNAHEGCFARECSRIGRTPEPTMPVVCERFRVVYRVGATGSGKTL